MCINQIRKIINDANCIILDIEGTITSIDFVKKELFPYAEQQLEEFVKNFWSGNKMHEITDLLLKGQDCLPPNYPVLSEKELTPEEVISHLRWQMTLDLKTSGLKTLQGRIWKCGYDAGLIRGHVYDDVPIALNTWKEFGKKVYIYSSGSIEAQKLLLRNTILGDLSRFIDGYFDLNSGSKVEAESYVCLTQVIGENPEKIVFFTDRPKEVMAAKEAGMKVIRVTRDSVNPFLELEAEFIGQEHGTVDSFSSLL